MILEQAVEKNLKIVTMSSSDNSSDYLEWGDWVVIVVYFVAVLGVGLWVIIFQFYSLLSVT
jgi:hypothetical protein